MAHAARREAGGQAFLAPRCSIESSEGVMRLLASRVFEKACSLTCFHSFAIREQERDRAIISAFLQASTHRSGGGGRYKRGCMRGCMRICTCLMCD